jgi:hypothetical protein
MKKIKLTKGLYALVDNDDFERCNAFKWHAHVSSRGTKVYARRRARIHEKARWGEFIRLHHYVLGISPKELPPGHVVDHVNHKGLDCRKFIKGQVQLEVITQTENMERSPGWKRAPAYTGPDRSNEWN